MMADFISHLETGRFGEPNSSRSRISVAQPQRTPFLIFPRIGPRGSGNGAWRKTSHLGVKKCKIISCALPWDAKMESHGPDQASLLRVQNGGRTPED